jgi:alkanesulfonate monooxygenase SsuD/methylene tetrahydromethanopterin reductase-like flavin-dependent oxidoreductase (luciferase family)
VSHALQFGFSIPCFANPGPGFFRTPNLTALDGRQSVDAAVEAERLGYDSIWMADHLMHGIDGGILDGWTTLSVIAGRTSKVKLGTIHLAQPFRHPALCAKASATLDHLSDGRLLFFYDCGWGEAEVRHYGLDWPPEAERIARMDEGLKLIDALWRSEEPLDFKGDFFHTNGAICRPKPAQRPRPPVWLGEARHDAWVDTICRHMDGWNSTPASPTRMAEKLEAVKAGCGRIGRDYDALEISLEIQILVAPTEAEARDRLRAIAAHTPAKNRPVKQDLLDYLDSNDQRPLSAVLPDWIVGSTEAVAEQIRTFSKLGVHHFMLWFVDFPSMDGMRLFAENVIPAVRSAR